MRLQTLRTKNKEVAVMLSKESKIKVLENFYALDYIFFGKPLKKFESCCPAVRQEYLSVKGALMSIIVEMLKLIEHSPEKLTERIKTDGLLKNAREGAKLARENSKRIVSSKRSRDNIKAELREAIRENKDVDISKEVEQKIREKAFCLAADNLLIARLISESKNYKNLNDWSGRILEDSYKILRDSLVESAVIILRNEEPK